MSKSTFDVDLSEESGQEEAGESVVNQCHGWLELTQQTIQVHNPFLTLRSGVYYYFILVRQLSPVQSSLTQGQPMGNKS